MNLAWLRRIACLMCVAASVGIQLRPFAPAGADTGRFSYDLPAAGAADLHDELGLEGTCTQLLHGTDASEAPTVPARRAATTPPSLSSTPSATSLVDDTVRMAEDWLGPNVRAITNRSGDKVFLSEDGLRRIRFDIRNPAPHSSPHAHVKEFVNGRWVKSGPIFPTDVPPR